MKISILTQPLGHNYGGILQAYALQQCLIKLGHDVETLNRRPPSKNITDKFKVKVKNYLKFLLGYIKYLPTEEKKNHAYKNLVAFVNQYIVLSPEVYTRAQLEDYYKNNSSFDAFIVGSDQVWRPKYSPSLYDFYLDFTDVLKTNVKKISYSASFGVNSWEYTNNETKICKELINKFDAVSVREVSAQTLCEKHFDISPQVVVDPTMLLTKEDYQKLFTEESESNNTLLAYILDPEKEKEDIVSIISEITGNDILSFMPKKITEVPQIEMDASRYPKVGKWLKSFSDASYVVTDSFHGAVFSIIFNKPFIVIGNKKRGVARFESLLSLFGLDNRLVISVKDLDSKVINESIDWDRVNEVKNEKVKDAKGFLRASLSE
jgi:hypothetical protein